MPKSISKKKIEFLPHPEKVLIKITRKQFSDLFSKWITRDDGSKCQLFIDIEESDGYDRKFTQNVSVGIVVAVGEKVEGIYPGDIAIIDYLVSTGSDALIGFVNNDMLVAVNAKTKYHTFDALPNIDGRKAFVTGDYDDLSPILGVIRGGKAVAFSPYIFLVHKTNKLIKILPNGQMVEIPEEIATREVVSASNESGYRDGDSVVLKELDLFSRIIDNKELSICYEAEILCKK
jgi:hypothetical protein